MGSIEFSTRSQQAFRQAEHCLQQQDFRAALRHLEVVIRNEGKTPGAAYAYHISALAHAELGNIRQAIDSSTQALKMRTNPDLMALFYSTRASLHSQVGNIDAAINDASRIVDLFPKHPNPYNERASYLLTKKDYLAAIKDLTRAIGLDSSNYVFYLNRAQARHRSGDLQNALSDFNQAVRMEPMDADNFFFRGILYRDIGDLKAAFSDLDKAVRLDPRDFHNLQARGEICFQLGNYDGAIADLAQVIRMQPASASSLNQMLAHAYAGRSLEYRFGTSNPAYGYEEALADADNAIRLQPNDPVGYYVRGRAHMQYDMAYIDVSRPSQYANHALNDFARVLRMDSEYAVAYADRAQLHQKYGNLKQAFEDMKTALSLRPQQPNGSNWLIAMQVIVNAFANDGYKGIELDTAMIMGKPGYNAYARGTVTDWDHYLQWRLRSR